MNAIEKHNPNEVKKDVETHKEEETLKKCFAYCVNNFHVETFVNEEEQCIKNCAQRHYSYFNQLQNSDALLENPLYLKFY